MYRHLVILGLAAMVFTTPARAAELPDKTKTPGVVLKKVPDRRAATCLTRLTRHRVRVGDPITLKLICVVHYTSCIRDVPDSMKTSVYRSYGLPRGNHTGFCNSDQGCEVDHLISIELGGANDPKNLWPQRYEDETFNAHVKDRLENFLHKQVCDGRISLTTAQKEISGNWVASFKKRIGPTPED